MSIFLRPVAFAHKTNHLTHPLPSLFSGSRYGTHPTPSISKITSSSMWKPPVTLPNIQKRHIYIPTESRALNDTLEDPDFYLGLGLGIFFLLVGSLFNKKVNEKKPASPTPTQPVVSSPTSADEEPPTSIDPLDLVLTQIGVVTDAKEDRNTLKKAFQEIAPNMRMRIIAQFDNKQRLSSSIRNDLADVLIKLSNNPKLGNSLEERRSKAIKFGLPMITKILEKHKELIAKEEIDPTIPLDFKKMAEAADSREFYCYSYVFCINKKTGEVNLDASITASPLDRSITQIITMMGLSTKEDRPILERAFQELDPNMRIRILAQFSIGQRLSSRTPTIADLLINLSNNKLLGLTKEERLFKMIQLGLPLITEILEIHQELIDNKEMDPTIPLNLKKIAEAANSGEFYSRHYDLHTNKKTGELNLVEKTGWVNNLFKKI